MANAEAGEGSRRRSYPRFRREGEAPRVALTDDDVAMIRHVFRHRFVRAEDLFRLMPGRSPDRLSRRLMLLYRAGYLDRPLSQIDRFHQGGGSQSLVYGLDNAGARLLKERGVSVGAADWRTRNRAYKRENLDHTLAVAKFMIDVEAACRDRPDLSFIPFEEILTKAPEATRRSKYPMRWPVEISYGGARGVVHLQPDAIFGLRQKTETGSRSAYFFVEVDRGTMTICPSERVIQSEAFVHRATVLRKLVAYAESWRQKQALRLGATAPRTLFVANSSARKKTIQDAATDVERQYRLPARMLLFSASAQDRISLSSILETDGNILGRHNG